MLIKIVLGVLGLLTLYFAVFFFKDYKDGVNKGNLEKSTSFLKCGIIGFIANFFDALGIGSFATLTAMLRTFKQTEDRVLPGTLNVGCTIPVVTEAFIFITVIKVEPVTLFTLLISATIGAKVGAGVVANLNEKKVQLGMAIALLVVALLMIASQIDLMPVGGTAIGLSGAKLVIAAIGNFIFGALMTLGIGLYAPCMALIFALGMSPKIAFPIMMGSSAYLMPVASTKFIKEHAYNRKASITITISGLLGILLAALIVKKLPIKILTWLVIVVIIYTSATMFKAYKSKESKQTLSN